MLEIIEYGKDEYSFPSLVVLGCFDAIHAGHRELFKKAKLQAKINGLDLGVMMFRDGKGGRQIYSFEERVEMLKAYGVKFVLVIDYTPEFKQTMPLDFLSAIEEKVNVKAYMSGKDFRFGKGAKGKSSTLKNYAEDEDNGVWYMPVKDVTSGGEKISTTLVKQCLDGGDVKRAAELLGENFFVEGEVVEGAHRGAGILGFPTVNLKYPEWKYPVKHGVYRVNVLVDGVEYLGIANFGGRPTFDDDSEVLEVHIRDFEGDLYGRTIKVSFVGFMRSIVKFGDAAALAAQLAQDESALDLPLEKFFGLYPLEESEPAVEEVASDELDGECAPPEEVFEGAPVQQPETQYISEQPAEPSAEVVEEEQVADRGTADGIVPAWELLSDDIDNEVVEVTPAEAVEKIAEETAQVPAEFLSEEAVVVEDEQTLSDVVIPEEEPAAAEVAEELAPADGPGADLQSASDDGEQSAAEDESRAGACEEAADMPSDGDALSEEDRCKSLSCGEDASSEECASAEQSAEEGSVCSEDEVNCPSEEEGRETAVEAAAETAEEASAPVTPYSGQEEPAEECDTEEGEEAACMPSDGDAVPEQSAQLAETPVNEPADSGADADGDKESSPAGEDQKEEND